MIRKVGPQQLRSCAVVMSDEETKRVRAFIVKCGSIRIARERMGMSDSVFEAARSHGRMLKSSRDKVIAALEAQEREAGAA